MLRATAWPPMRFGWMRRFVATWRWAEPEALAMVSISMVFLLGGAVTIVLYFAASDWLGSRYTPALSVVALTFGIAGPLLPWERWTRWPRLLYPIAGVLIVAFGTSNDAAGLGSGLAILALVFVTVGITQPPGTSALIALPALLLLVAGHSAWTPVERGSVALALPLSVLAGEAVAQVVARQKRAERRISHLLAAVRALASVESEHAGAQVLCDVTVDLLAADAAVFLAPSHGTESFVNRARGGHPALASRVPLLVDVLGMLRGSSRDSHADVVLLADAATASGAAAGVVRRDDSTSSGTTSVLLVPLTDGDIAVGAMVALFARPVRSLPVAIRQTAELIAQEGGRMITRVRETQQLTHAAETDALTDLANRRTFVRALERVAPGDAIVVIDLDHFKLVNDRYGHDAGDETLQSFARCLKEASRQNDTVARLGGEEFGMVLPGAGRVGGMQLLSRLRSHWNDLPAVTTFSAGVAVHGRGRSALETLRDADQALYRAKEAGRDRDELAQSHAGETDDSDVRAINLS